MTSEHSSRRVAFVSGRSSLPGHEGPFTGLVEFERREEGVYYTWRLTDSKGDFLGMKAQLVSSRTIPPEADPFEHALEHARESLRRYRVNRKHVYELLESNWYESAG